MVVSYYDWRMSPSAALPSVRRTLHLEVASRLGAGIVSGEMPAGTVLPNESALSAELGVSRTVLREAVKVLAAKALLEVRPKTGTRVRPREAWHLLDPEVLEWQLSAPLTPQLIGDLIAVRLAIEPAAAGLAALHAVPHEVEAIEAACEAMAAADDGSEASVDADLAFHLAILQASHNAFMPPFGALISTALRASFRVTSANREAYRRSIKQHRAVCDRVRAYDADGATLAMRRLLESTGRDARAARARKTR
jgi:DNA-binding FadR family transcriptional regulator